MAVANIDHVLAIAGFSKFNDILTGFWFKLPFYDVKNARS
jgi:hypothetical protein